MTQGTHEQTGKDTGSCRAPDGKRRVNRWLAAIALLGLGAAGGAFGTIAAGAGAHDGWGHGFRMHGYHRSLDADGVIERLQRASAWTLGAVDATDEQRERIDAILADTVNDVFPLRAEHHAHWRDLVAELSRPRMDREGLERVRAAELALADQATVRILDAAVEIADVLDPQQRQRLVEEFAEHVH